MYKVCKDEGRSENIYLRNTETMGEVNLGRASAEIIEALKDEGYDIAGAIALTDHWDLEVNETTKEKLVKIAMPMKKPVRNKKQQPVTATATTKSGKPVVDILDIIYGLAK